MQQVGLRSERIGFSLLEEYLTYGAISKMVMHGKWVIEELSNFKFWDDMWNNSMSLLQGNL